MIGVKIIKKKKNASGTSEKSAAWNNYILDSSKHADRADYADLSEYANRAGYSSRAAYADVARDLSDDSPILEKFLSRIDDDTAHGLIRFLKGIITGAGEYGINELGKAFLNSLRLPKAEISASGIASVEKVLSRMFSGYGFSSGLLGGKDFAAWTDADGRGHIETDFLVTRVKAVFASLELREVTHLLGNYILSAAGSRIVRTKYVDINGSEVSSDSAAVRAYMLADDGTMRTRNKWKVGDMVLCHTFDIEPGVYENISNRHYGRLVTATGTETLEGKTYHYVDISMLLAVSLEVDNQVFDCIGYDDGVDNDVPASGDVIVQVGSQTDPQRQHLIQFVVSGDEAPAIIEYAGVNDYNLGSHRVMTLSPKGNKVVSSHFEVISSADAGISEPLTCNRGAWFDGMKCGRYDVVTHTGSTWLCRVKKGEITTEEPSDTAQDWLIQARKGDKGDELLQLLLNITQGSGFYREGQGFVARLETAVIKGNTDITSQYHPSQIVWTRESEADDTAWNEAHRNVGTTINISTDDLVNDTTFVASLYDASGRAVMAKTINF